MIRFKNHEGFSIAEIMIALFVMATLLSAIIVLQQSSVQMISFFSRKLEYILQLRSLSAERAMERAQGIEKEQVEKKPELLYGQESFNSSIMVTTKPIDKKSSLSSYKNIVIEQLRARWKEGVSTRSVALISFLYKPEKKKT